MEKKQNLKEKIAGSNLRTNKERKENLLIYNEFMSICLFAQKKYLNFCIFKKNILRN